LNDQYKACSIDTHIAVLEGATPKLSGIGIPEYFTTAGYRLVREFQETSGALSGGRRPGGVAS